MASCDRMERRGHGRCLSIVRYTLPLLQRGEKVRFAAANRALFRDHLAWELTEVVDRRSVDHLHGGPHIPLMSLIPLLDENTLWGRRFSGPTWRPAQTNYEMHEQVGLCWASNPQDRTMHAYKSCTPEKLLTLQRQLLPACTPISLQTDQVEAHQRTELQPAQPEWSDTLRRITRCRHVISVDTAVAHLAAGSDRPTTVILSDPPDWRWRPVPEDPNAPPWYPSLSIAPQTLKPTLHL